MSKFVFEYELQTDKGITIPFTSLVEAQDVYFAFYDLRKMIFEDKSMKLFKQQPRLKIKNVYLCMDQVKGSLAADPEIAIYLT